MAREQELKLTVAQADWAVISAWLEKSGAEPLPMQVLCNTYFDTADGQLNRQRIALRVRQHGEEYVQTLKTKGTATRGLHDRHEWDWPLETRHLDIDVLEKSPIKSIVERQPLQPVFSTDFNRNAWLWCEGDQAIEFALDRGEVRAGSARRAISEVELELKAGTTQALMEQAEALSRICPVFLNPISKAEQGYFIAGLYRPAPAQRAGAENPKDLKKDPEKDLDVWLAAMGHFALTGHGEYLQQAVAAAERLREGSRSGKSLSPEQWSLMYQAHSELSPGTPDEVIAQLLEKPIIGQCQLALVSL